MLYVRVLICTSSGTGNHGLGCLQTANLTELMYIIASLNQSAYHLMISSQNIHSETLHIISLLLFPNKRILTTRNQRRRIHNPRDRSQVIIPSIASQRQLHIRIPRGDDRIRVRLQVDSAVFLGALRGLAFCAERGAELAESQPVSGVLF